MDQNIGAKEGEKKTICNQIELNLNSSYQVWLKELLPRVPVPSLQDTLRKYVESLRPFLSAQKLSLLEREVIALLRLNGNCIQECLLLLSENIDNWVNFFWLDDMYFCQNLALPININPGTVLPSLATKVIEGILNFKEKIDKFQLNPEFIKKKDQVHYLCMEQYSRLFTCYRNPGKLKDHWLLHRKPSNHIIVMHKNKIYKVNVYDNEFCGNEKHGRVERNFCSIRHIIHLILHHNFGVQSGIESSLGFLTSLERRAWGEMKQSMKVDNFKNKVAFEEIENSLFVLCLDEKYEKNHFPEDAFMQANNGAGSAMNSGNRWFDKTLQFIVGEDGYLGVCYEHSAAEGIVVLSLIESLVQTLDGEVAKEKQVFCAVDHDSFKNIGQVHFELTESARAGVVKAAAHFDKAIENLEVKVLNFTKFGHKFPKKVKISPDVFWQICLQLAFYKTHGYCVHTYESGSIRRFFKGRVDNIRSCHAESVKWVKSMSGYTKKNREKVKTLFEEAVEKQTQVMNDAISGYGVDNHVLAVERICEQFGYTPGFFQSKEHAEWKRFKLSTSQVATKIESCFMSYGPVDPDGYGCSYNPSEDAVMFVCTAFRDCLTTNLQLFTRNIEHALLEMQALCLDA